MARLRFLRSGDQHDEDPNEDQPDDDAPLARDVWFTQQLGEEWQEEEPGIYRHVSFNGTPGER